MHALTSDVVLLFPFLIFYNIYNALCELLNSNREQKNKIKMKCLSVTLDLRIDLSAFIDEEIVHIRITYQTLQ